MSVPNGGAIDFDGRPWPSAAGRPLKNAAMNSEPDEKLLGRFNARSNGLHLIKLATGYRIESWDSSDPEQTLTQQDFESLDEAVETYLKRISAYIMET